MFLLLTVFPSIAVKSRSESVLNIWYQERVAYSIDMWKIYLQRTIDLTCFENGSRTITVSVMRQYASDWRIWYFIWILTFGVIYSQWCVTHVSLTLKTGNPLNKMASFTLKSNYKKNHHFIPKLKRDILTRKIWRNPSCVLRTYFKSQWYYSLVCADQWTCEREIDRYEIPLAMGRLSTIVHWLNPVIPLDMTWIAILWRKRKASLIGLQ